MSGSMICRRCAGLVVPDRSSELIGWPVYCVNCGWRGEARLFTDEIPSRMERIWMPTRGRPRLPAEEVARRAAEQEANRVHSPETRAKVSRTMRAWYEKRRRSIVTAENGAIELQSSGDDLKLTVVESTGYYRHREASLNLTAAQRAELSSRLSALTPPTS